MTTVIEMKYSLSNGATLIQSKKTGPNRVVVLARVDFGFHPFVTWLANESDEDASVLHCDCGRYFDNLPDAVESFVERASL